MRSAVSDSESIASGRLRKRRPDKVARATLAIDPRGAKHSPRTAIACRPCGFEAESLAGYESLICCAGEVGPRAWPARPPSRQGLPRC
jgi:hypothetical protein